MAEKKIDKGSEDAKQRCVGWGWGAVSGGGGTFLGGERAQLAMSLLHEAHTEARISFLTWMIAAAPVVVIMTLIAVVTLCRRIPDGLDDVRAATRMLDDRVRRLGPMSGRERRLPALGLLTIVAWVTVGHRPAVGLGVIAMVSGSLLFCLRFVAWPSA